jgi:hypothetical protein
MKSRRSIDPGLRALFWPAGAEHGREIGILPRFRDFIDSLAHYRMDQQRSFSSQALSSSKIGRYPEGLR